MHRKGFWVSRRLSFGAAHVFHLRFHAVVAHVVDGFLVHTSVIGASGMESFRLHRSATPDPHLAAALPNASILPWQRICLSSDRHRQY